MNALGINDKFMIGGAYVMSDNDKPKESSGGTADAMYFHNSQSRAPSWMARYHYSYIAKRVTDQEENLLHQWTTHDVIVSFGLYYPVTRVLSFGLTTSYTGEIHHADKSYDKLPPDKDVQGIGVEPSLTLRHDGYDGFLSETQSISFKYSPVFAIQGDTVEHISANILWEKSIVPGFKFIGRAEAVYSPRINMNYAVQPSSIAPILPATFYAYHYAGASAGFEKYIHKWKWGMLSIMMNYQLIESYGPDLGWEFDDGVGAAVNFYINRLALPVISLSFNYNVNKQQFEAGGGIGLSF
jgi:hypothetical protein